MKRLPAVLRFLACLVSALAWCGLTPPASAQTSLVPFGQGTHAFRRILFDLKLEPLESVTELDDAPHTLLIVLGDTTVLDQVPGGLKDFLERGGAVLLATDRMTPNKRLQRDFGFRVTGASFRADPRWAEVYKNIPECPLLAGVRGADPDLLGELPAGQGVRLSRVATNRPSCLDGPLTVPGLSVVAALPPGCAPQVREAVFDPGFRAGRIFAVGGEVGEGRLLVLADHSLFINDMMLQPDTDNIDFAYNCVEWLTQGKEARTRVLFVEEGKVNSAFDIPLKQVDVPLPPEEVLVPLVDQALSQVEQEDVFNKLLLDTVPYRTVVGALVLGLTALLAFYGLYRLSRSRHRVDLWAPLLEKALAKQQPARSLLEQRHRAMLGQGNLWEPARALAREALARAGIPGDMAGTPTVSVRGGWWRRWVVGRHVLGLWRIAHGSRPVRVTPARFARLVRDLEELEAALAAGTVRLEFPAPPAAPPRRGAVLAEGTGA
jgi:hypothetical protein